MKTELKFFGVYEIESFTTLKVSTPNGTLRTIALNDTELMRLAEQATQILFRRIRRKDLARLQGETEGSVEEMGK